MHYGIDPDTLSDEKWAKMYQDFLFVEKRKREMIKVAMEDALTVVMNQLFSSNG